MTSPLFAAPDPFADALVAAGPHPSLGRDADVYAWLAGSWDVEVIDYPQDAAPRHGRGEWHFAWVLEGRAMQDVWIVPSRAEREPEPKDVVGNRYGTSLRIYDPAAGTWEVLWRNPVTGARDRLTGLREGDRVVHTGTNDAGHPMRWTFGDIRNESFRWLGETSYDGGASWRLEAEFLGRRSAPQTVAPRIVTWRWTDRPGLETLRLSRDGAAVVVESDVVVDLEGITEVHYVLRYDAAWEFLRGSIESRREGITRSLEIVQVETGVWTVDGVRRADLTGCSDLDLMVTPFTNTPPLLRLDPAPGGTAGLRVAWVRFPEMSVNPVDQEYLGPDSEGPIRRYRYRNLESGFEGELEADERRLVTEYGPWLMVGPAGGR